ncbi:hypothetical protein MCRH_0259 [Moraxella catarrhalis RH4]|uniref:Uncharacterized protein n=1 Tax=Moraxella catarrhalis TaxID=480 RepID=A0A3Q9GIL1_MORCA|nr:hypothetical protein EJK53_0228 [Moraxella catarrhalis]EKF84480.1 hypothetical protein MCRH_0259 [Moraxella catarrhalis RH4]
MAMFYQDISPRHCFKHCSKTLFQSAVLRHCQGRHQLSVKRLNYDEGGFIYL